MQSVNLNKWAFLYIILDLYKLYLKNKIAFEVWISETADCDVAIEQQQIIRRFKSACRVFTFLTQNSLITLPSLDKLLRATPATRNVRSFWLASTTTNFGIFVPVVKFPDMRDRPRLTRALRVKTDLDIRRELQLEGVHRVDILSLNAAKDG